MKRLARILALTLITLAMFAMVGCDKEKEVLKVGDKQLEFDTYECVSVNYMITDTAAIINNVPVESPLDGYKPVRVIDKQIISDWTNVKGGTTPYTGIAEENLTLYPIWTECTEYTDRTPVGYYYNGSYKELSEGDFDKFMNDQGDEHTSFINAAKKYKYHLKDSSCIVIDFSKTYTDKDEIEITVEMSVNKLYLIGVEEKTFNTKIKINARSTELHIYMDNMLMKGLKGSPVIDTSSVNFAIVTIEAAGDCSITGNKSDAISGDNIAITGMNGVYTILGGDNTDEKSYSGINCNRIYINNTKVIVKGGLGIKGQDKGRAPDNQDGEQGGKGGTGGCAVTVSAELSLVKCTLELNGGKGGAGGTGGKGNNSSMSWIVGARNGGKGGTGGDGGAMLDIASNSKIEISENDVLIKGQGGLGGDGGEGGLPGGDTNKGVNGEKGSTGNTGVVASLTIITTDGCL